MSDVNDDDEGIVGVFMFEWQLEHIQHALAYYAGNAYMSEEKLEEIDDLMIQLEEGKMVADGDETIAYVMEGDDSVH